MILAILFRHFGFLASQRLRLFLASLSLILSEPDEGSSRSGLCALNLIFMFEFLPEF